MDSSDAGTSPGIGSDAGPDAADPGSAASWARVDAVVDRAVSHPVAEALDAVDRSVKFLNDGVAVRLIMRLDFAVPYVGAVVRVKDVA